MVAPIFKVALLPTYNVPPAVVLLAVNAPISNVPPDTVKLEDIAAFTLRVTVLAVLAITISEKVVVKDPPILCALVPLNVVVDVPAVKAVVAALLIQLPLKDILKLFACKVPLVSVKLFNVIAAGNKRPLLLFNVMLLKPVTPEKVCCPVVPLKVVVPLFTMVPLFTSNPAIFNVPAAEVVIVAPVFIVRLLQLTLLEISGILVAVAEMVTLEVDVGKIPEHQLPAFAQSVLVAPVHCPLVAVDFTVVYAVAVQLEAVTCNVYVPAFAAAYTKEGFCNDEV